MIRKMKNKAELLAKNEAFQKELKSEVDHAQSEVTKLVRNALIAGGLAVLANVLQKAFFKEETLGKRFEMPSEKPDFLTSEISEKATLQALTYASKSLSAFLESLDE